MEKSARCRRPVLEPHYRALARIHSASPAAVVAAGGYVFYDCDRDPNPGTLTSAEPMSTKWRRKRFEHVSVPNASVLFKPIWEMS